MSDRTPETPARVPEEFAELVVRYLDDALSEAESADLNRQLAESEHLRRYFWFACRTARQRHDFGRDKSTLPFATATEIRDDVDTASAGPRDADNASPSTYSIRRARGGRTRAFRYAAAAVFLIVAGIAATQMWRGGTTPDGGATAVQAGNETLATVTDVRGATWSDDHAMADLGAALPQGPLRLTSGSAELLMRSTAQVALLGPADVEILGPNRCRLTRGRIVATVPQMAHGFAVETPTHEVVDLGTRFGVEVDDMGLTHVHVFEGRVSVVERGGAALPTLVTAGRAVLASDGAMREVKVDERRFTVPGAAETQLVTIDGATTDAATPASVVPGRHEGPKAVLFRERTVTLDKPLRVLLADITQVHAGDPAELEPTAAELPAGTTVVSYLLHFDPPGDAPLARNVVTIRFNEPVLGVIADHDTLITTHKQFGLAAVQYPVRGSRMQTGLEGPEHSVADTLSLDADRRTLHADLVVKGPSCDTVRILVATQP
ncbi:MAG: hypothetical protein GC159_21200 [Phycisphaera sp.]|nr:hypothetical protein [Phycisphaera sp.]